MQFRKIIKQKLRYVEKIGLVTITYNSEDVLKDFLDSALNQTLCNFIIYIIDNNSKDSTLNILDRYQDSRIKIIKNSHNLGVAKANNQGIKLALKEGCSQVLIINNDVKFESKLLSKMIQVQSEKKCSLVAPKMMYFSNPSYVWYAGSRFIKRKGMLPIHKGNKEKDLGQFDGVFQVEYAPTCCLLVKKEVFEDIGFMDEKYFVYFDDTDFLYRVLKDGRHQLFYFSDVEFYHKVGSLTKSFDIKNEKEYRGEFFIKQNIRNHVYFLKKTKTLYAFFFIAFLFFRNNLQFIIKEDIPKNFKTWILINKSYFQGIIM